jgi:glyoxylase-like metal-dependent hydrolase (beta-lactamase superfamily II)
MRSNLVLKQMEVGPMMNFIYIVGCANTRRAAVVDPAWDIPSIRETAQGMGLELNHVLLTHCHPDHVNGLSELVEATNARVHVHPLEAEYIRQMAAQFGVPVDFVSLLTGNYEPVSDGDEIMLGELPVRVLHTPGHTPGSVCYLAGGNLFSGDTLFINACGRVDLPGGDPGAMWFSLNRKLAALDGGTVIYPGHNYGGRCSSTIGEQRRSNPYMRYSSEQDFVRAMGGD